MTVCYTDVQTLIRKLEFGRSAGPDRICAESNVVKKGGISSPVLFNVYMDDLGCVLNRSNIGGRIGGEIVNHLNYADDLCLICLSSDGMQKLLNGCSKYATEHSLSYNANKSYFLCFKATTIKFEEPTLQVGQIIIIIIMIRFIHHFLRNVLNQECLYHSAT